MLRLILTLLLGAIAHGGLFASVIITNGLTHRHSLHSGATDEGEIIIKNVGKRPERILVYFQDLIVGCENENLNLAPAGSLAHSNASFIKAAARERLLQPGEEFPLSYSIEPQSDTLSGSYWSLLMVEVKAPIDTTRLESGVQVSSNVRYAIQIITDFSCPDPVEVEFSQVELRRQGDGQILAVKLANQSKKVVLPRLKLEIYDQQGELLLEQKSEFKKIYPGQCRQFPLPVADLPPGQFQAVLVADCGESELFGMTLNLEVNE